MANLLLAKDGFGGANPLSLPLSPVSNRTPPAVSLAVSNVGEWTGQRELIVAVGAGAPVMPDNRSHSTPTNSSCTSHESCISLKDGGVRTTAYAVLSSSGSTPILAPDNPPTVSAVLGAPQVLIPFTNDEVYLTGILPLVSAARFDRDFANMFYCEGLQQRGGKRRRR